MKFIKSIKQNLPVLLLISVIPYFFYNEPTLSQAIIAAVLGGIAAFKYYLESKEQPDYVKLFEKQIQDLTKNANETMLANHKKVMEEIEILRAKQNGATLKGNIDKKINLQGWG